MSRQKIPPLRQLDTGPLEDAKAGLEAARPVATDKEARDKALGVLSSLTEDIGAINNRLAWLSGFFGEESLGSAVVGAMGISASEMQQQVGPMRQAIHDIPLEKSDEAERRAS